MTLGTTLTWPPKDPSDVTDFQIDWTALLNGDTISTSTWTPQAGSGLAVNSSTNTTTSATVWLSGGTAGVYRVTNLITTAGGRTFERSVTLTVADL